MRHFFWTVLFVVMGTLASAHSPLASVEPADGVTLAAAPEALNLTFRTDIRLTRLSVAHDDGDEINLDMGDQTDFTTVYDIPFQDLGAGSYVVTWRGLSKDGHVQVGTYGFTVQ